MGRICNMSAVSCPYHACMGDNCQLEIVQSQGVDFGTPHCKTFESQCAELEKIGIVCFVQYSDEIGTWRPMVYRKRRENEQNDKMPHSLKFEPTFSGYPDLIAAQEYAVQFAFSIAKRYNYPECISYLDNKSK